MPQKNKLLVVTAVWGDWHIAKYFELNLPTLLADGNFPALATNCDITYLIYTSRADMDRVRDAPGLRELSKLMKLEFRTIAGEMLKDPISAHHAVWAEATKQAVEESSFVLLMPPDVAWSDGSFEHVGRLIEAGKKVIFMTYLRAESESFAAALKRYRQSGSSTISVSGAQLVEVCLQTLHPLMAAYLRDSSHFPIHPEMMLWAVPNEGLLCRVLAREMFIYDPSMVKLNAVNLPATKLDPGWTHMIDDSDALFAVSLAPFDKEFEWYRWPRIANAGDIAEWWLDYDSWVNDIVVAKKVRWHFRPVTEKTWQARELGSDLFVRRAASTREGRRIFHVARRAACTVAASLIAIAVQSGVMSRVARGHGGAMIFLPINKAFSDYPSHVIEQLAAVGAENDITRLLRSHFIPDDDRNGSWSLEERLGSANEIDLTAADGNPLRIARRNDGIEVNGVRVIEGPVSSGKNKIYLIERLLAPIARCAIAPTPAPVDIEQERGRIQPARILD